MMRERLSSAKWWRGLLVNLLLIVVVYLALGFYFKQGLPTGPAPAFRAETLEGVMVQVPAVRERPMLLHFWATWCGVCRLENPNIDAIAEDHAVVTIAMQSGSDLELEEVLANEGYKFEVINDELGVLAARYAVTAVPLSFILDRNGEIKFVERGYTTTLGLRLRLWWAGLGI